MDPNRVLGPHRSTPRSVSSLRQRLCVPECSGKVRRSVKDLLQTADGESAANARSRARSLDTVHARELVRAKLFTGPPTPLSIGRFEVLVRIGAGGNGVVYAARDPKLDRKVAIKCLHGERVGQGSQAHARLVREARTMARLSHPNVAAVFEVGSFDSPLLSGSTLYVAMELIDGDNLDAWQRAATRGVHEIVDAYLQAARGLAAAHDLGVVHRDFKPHNAMIDGSGRVRVLDFGLARSHEGDEIHEIDTAPEAGRPAAPGSTSILGSCSGGRLTRSDAIVGTPAYLAPESLQGRPVTAKSDQFSFCVSMFEALYGQRPFQGPTLSAVLSAIALGKISTTPPRRDVPRDLDTILRRGLSLDPDERFATMHDLAAALERAMQPRHARAVTGFAIGIAALLWVAWPANAGSGRCSTVSWMRDTWDERDHEGLRAAFAASGSPIAQDTLERIVPALDDYATRLGSAYTSACEGKSEGAPKSAAASEAALTCLTANREALEATTSVLAQAEHETVNRAVAMVSALPSIDACVGAGAHDSTPFIPDDPELASAVQEVRASLAEASSHNRAGHRERARRLADDALRRAEDLGYEPVVAEALYWRALVSGPESTGEHEEARRRLEAAYWLAVRLGHDEVAAAAAAGMIADLQPSEDGLALAQTWVRHAQSALARLPEGAPKPHSEMLLAYSDLLSRAGDLEAALARAQEALQIRAEAGLDLSRAQLQLGTALAQVGRYDEATQAVDAALDELAERFGPAHPDRIVYLANAASVDVERGDLEQAAERLAAAREVAARFAETNPLRISAVAMNQGVVAHMQEDYETAIEYFVEADRVLAEHDPEGIEIARNAVNIASLYFAIDQYEPGLQFARKAVQMHEERVGPRHLGTGSAHTILANILLELHRMDEAERHYRQALEILSEALPPDAAALAPALANLGNFYKRADRCAEAIDPFERALAIHQRQGEVSKSTIQLQFRLAKCLWDAGGDRARAVKLARQALDEARSDELSAPGMTWSEGVEPEKIEAWLERHRLGTGTRTGTESARGAD